MGFSWAIHERLDIRKNTSDDGYQRNIRVQVTKMAVISFSCKEYTRFSTNWVCSLISTEEYELFLDFRR